MRNFIVYKSTGEILRSGVCHDADYELQTQGADELLMEGEAHALTHYIQAGQVVEMGARPSRLHTWNWTTLAWESDRTYDIDQIRIIRNAKLRSSDWTDTISAQQRLSPSDVAAWTAYRQELRDITSLPDLSKLVWPTPPGASQPYAAEEIIQSIML